MILVNLAVLAYTTVAAATYASSISSCPALTPRTSKATSVHDLRIDDIKMVAALGDRQVEEFCHLCMCTSQETDRRSSITAGFAAKGIQGPTIVNLANLSEDRGVSFAIGGDSGALTLATLMENYQPNLKGMSMGEHLVEVSLSSYMSCLQLGVNI